MCARLSSLLLAACLCLLPNATLPGQSAAADSKAGRVDVQGDPLPPGAVARLGTQRFRPGSPVQWLRYSADGRQILSVEEYEPGRPTQVGRLWSASDGKELAGLLLPSKNDWLVTPDCQQLLTWDGPALRIWDTATGKLLREMQGSDGICDAALTADGKTLAVLRYPPKGRPSLRLWRLPEGRLRQEIAVTPTIEGKDLDPHALCFAAGETILAARSSSTSEQAVRRWDLATGRELPVLACRAKDHLAPVLSPDGRLLASAVRMPGADTHIRILDMATGKLRHELGPVEGMLFGLRFSPDGRTLALAKGCTADGLDLWDVASGKSLPAPPDDGGPINDVHLGHSVLAIQEGMDIALYDPITGKLRHKLKTPWRLLDELGQTGYQNPKWLSGSSRMALSPDGKHLAAALGVRSEGSRIRLWETASGKEITSADGAHDRSVVGLAFAPDGKTLASISEDHTVRLWDTSGRPLHTLSAFHQDDKSPDLATNRGRYRVMFSPDGKALAACSPFNWVRQWDVPTGKLQRQHLAADAALSALAYAPGGNTLLLGSHGRVIFWDAATGKERASLAAPMLPGPPFREGRQREEREEWLLDLAVSPDGRLLAVTRMEANDRHDEPPPLYELQLWELASRKLRWRIPQPSMPGIALPTRLPAPNNRFPIYHGLPRVAFAGDGKSLVWNREGIIEQVDVARGRTLRHLQGRADEVTALACSCASRLLAIVHKDASVRLLDLATGSERGRLHGHRGGVRCVAFSPDGRTLATGGDDTTVLLWDVADVLTREHRAPAPLSAAEQARLWEQLASSQGEVAAAAMARLQEAPTQTVPLLRGRLEPAPRIDTREMA